MDKYKNLPLHPMSENLVKILMKKTGNQDPMFFRIMNVYYMSLMASQMRCTIKGFGKTDIPINNYVINLSPSGTGKGYSTSFFENNLLTGFKEVFINHTFPSITSEHLEELANKRSRRNGTTIDYENESLEKEFDALGSFLFDFDSATVPAIKQHRHKLLLSNIGSLNYKVDEIGANLNAQEEILHTFLELYDLGMLKEKLIKSSAENKRHERLDGVSPANMLLFGTPTKLFDGGRTEAAFYELLDMGYARRCFYGLSKEVVKGENVTAEQMVDAMFDNLVDDAYIDDLNNKFMLLAHEANANKTVIIDRNELVYLMEYRLKCESKAAEYPEQQSVQAAELSHRYFKALKLAGVYAFIEDNIYITQTNLENAIALTELSGIAFEELMKPEKSYMKLANYLAESPTEVTLADLIEDLAFFKGNKAQKEELIALATAYGYKNNIIIKASKENGILFLKGESLQLTNRDELLISLSNHEAYNYDTKKVSFNDLTDLGDATGYHWCNHSFEGGHRRETSVLPGFNLLVLDVDNGMSVKSVQEVLKNYDHVIYTTKSHTQTNNSFRILIPTNYILYLDKEEYKKFINNILEVLPFEVDTASNQRSKKWLTHEGNTYVNDVGNLFDVLPYIPQTTKNEQRITTLMDSDMDRLEAWLINNTEDGNRNTQLYNYACILLDNGESYVDIRNKVLSLNSKLSDSLSEEEVDNTVLRSISTKVLTE